MKFQSKAAFVPQQLGANIWYKMVQDWHNLQTHTHTRQKLIHHRICRELNPMQARLD